MSKDFEEINRTLYGQPIMIGETNYSFLCFYNYKSYETEYVMLMAREEPSKLFKEFIVSSDLELRIMEL
jgi:hypothetical protein